MDSSGPSVRSTEKDCVCALGDIANATLSFAVLVVGVDTTEGDSLMGKSNGCLKRFGIK